MNMAGDPNQQNTSRPNVFGQDLNYPAPNAYWNRFTNSANYYSPPNFPFASNYGSTPVQFPIQTQTTAGAPYYPAGFNPVGSNYGIGMTVSPPSYSTPGSSCTLTQTYSYSTNPIPSTSNTSVHKQFVPCGMKRRTLSPP